MLRLRSRSSATSSARRCLTNAEGDGRDVGALRRSGRCRGKPEKALPVLGLFGGMAPFPFGADMVRLPQWARERERQMEAIAERTMKLLSNS